jgi:hypothetical protein
MANRFNENQAGHNEIISNRNTNQASDCENQAERNKIKITNSVDLLSESRLSNGLRQKPRVLLPLAQVIGARRSRASGWTIV